MIYLRRNTFFSKPVAFCVIIITFSLCSMAQCVITWEEINGIKKNLELTTAEKLNSLYLLKAKAVECNATADSVYARLLDFIAAYEYRENGNYKQALEYAMQSLRINQAGNKGSSAYYAMLGYFNVGYYYYAGLNMYDRALPYLDTATRLAGKFTNSADVIPDSKLIKAFILIKQGDYQKSTEESLKGVNYSLQQKDSVHFVQFLVLKAQSLYHQNQFQQSLSDLQTALPVIKQRNDQYNLATTLKTMAFIYAKTNQPTASDSCFKKSILARMETGHKQQIAADYRDLGILYESLGQYREAKRNYFKAIAYALQDKDSMVLATTYINLEQNSFEQERYKEAEAYFMSALKFLKLNRGTDILAGIKKDQLKLIGDRDLVFILASNQTELLLCLFKSTNDKKYLIACLQTALLTDDIITGMRHQQTAEQSKLYWRNFTRGFFNNAMEACFLDNNTTLAFFFMEKSSAVLLNDKLNEIGASAWLPAAEAAKEESYHMNVREQQRKISGLNESSAGYKKQQDLVFQAIEGLELFIKSLEQKYPLYYQYKYEDKVPSTDTLKQWLAKNNQSFIHYFNGDTATYILAITTEETQFIKLSKTKFNNGQLATFLQLTAHKETLNNQYSNYASLSHAVYKALFQPFHIPKGRVIICADNFLVPFEALTTDKAGSHFLIYDYTFSYVYSARYMLTTLNGQTAKGDFLGVAPVFFAAYQQVPDLKQSEKAIYKAADFYNRAEILSRKNANSKNFLTYVSNYTVVNIFSHANADSIHDEPFLHMSDSLIYLSQLQAINKPATKLVVLSACETNAGRQATGEGIYSLARGFSLVGIPSVAATLWKADESSIYVITELFNRNLSQGMNKDEALREAKLSFLQNTKNEKHLPFYWANMILVGDTQALKLSMDTSHWWWVVGTGCVVLLLFVFYKRKRTTKKAQEN